ncbi:GerAB/ArcD/ProY family transporter [Heyndrickxia vini]|uniref:Endospore germination permease n=1 Tax=Heyndrickxia vini TaxID=1476025 RepID=A0ABX7DZ16_9BACI|nr:endospore germination permease [Heyndrickxia vini]QQZ08723.1 endospore germination permease [Heyndrickxia vini]
MPGKIRISSIQMAVVMYPTIIATGIINLPLLTGYVSRKDSWISPIWATLIGFISVIVAYQLNKKFPEKTFIQYTEDILGRFFGKITIFFYLLFFLHFNGIVIREYTDFVWGTFFNQTPALLITAILLLFCAYAVHGGLEVIVRMGQIFFPLFTIPLFFFLFILLISMEPHNIVPIMENGIVPSLKGSFILSSWFSEMFLIAFFLPYLKKGERGLKWGMYTTIAITITLIMVNLVVLLVLGAYSYYALNPLLTAVRYISLGEFFEHVEAGLLAIWILGTFVKVTVLYHIVTQVASGFLNLKDDKVLIFPLGFLQLIMCFWVSKSFQELSSFFMNILPSYFITFLIVVPSLLLLISTVKNKLQKKKTFS